jgi:hypothetical protein
VFGEGGSDFDDVGAVGPDGLVEDLASDNELLVAIGDVGCRLFARGGTVDLVGVVRTRDVGAFVGFFFEGIADAMISSDMLLFRATGDW